MKLASVCPPCADVHIKGPEKRITIWVLLVFLGRCGFRDAIFTILVIIHTNWCYKAVYIKIYILNHISYDKIMSKWCLKQVKQKISLCRSSPVKKSGGCLEKNGYFLCYAVALAILLYLKVLFLLHLMMNQKKRIAMLKRNYSFCWHNLRCED